MTVLNCNDDKQQANLYELQGYDISITYSTTSITGEPRFSYRVNNNFPSRDFSGDDIVVEDTRLGRIVSVQLETNAADQAPEYVGLLLPNTRLAGEQSIDIQTVALLSRGVGFISTEDPRQLQTYNSVCLYGTAQVVSF